MSYPIDKIRADFPILNEKVHGHQLVYLDNGATTQTPKQVVEAMNDVYYKYNSNIHRGVHSLSIVSTEKYEKGRDIVANFINAKHREEVIFTQGTTDAVNVVAQSFMQTFFEDGDEVIISEMEHHSNIVPWQIVGDGKKVKLRVIPINEDGSLDMDSFKQLITSKVKLIAVSHISNVLGTINPVEEIVEIAHNNNIPVLIDGAQAIQHTKVDVQKLNADFYLFSGHKIYGPTGIGILYGKKEWLEKMKPVRGGGEMIQNVTFEETTFNELPYKFEAGTPNYVGAIGLAAAIEYINEIGLDNIIKYEDELFQYAWQELNKIDNIIFYGTNKNRTSLISFLIKDAHHFDIGTLLDKMGIAVRTGHHCAEPLVHKYNITGTVRASFALYNTKEEIDILVNAVKRIASMLS